MGGEEVDIRVLTEIQRATKTECEGNRAKNRVFCATFVCKKRAIYYSHRHYTPRPKTLERSRGVKRHICIWNGNKNVPAPAK